MIDFFHGTATAMITPFTKEGAVNSLTPSAA